MTRHTPSPSSPGSPLAPDSPSSVSTCTLDTSSSTLSFLSTPSHSPFLSAFPSSTSGYGPYPSYPPLHSTSLISDSATTRANKSGVTHAGAGTYGALSPAGSYGSYRGTSSLDEGSGSGQASGASSGITGSESSHASEMLSSTSRAIGMIESSEYGAQYPIEDESRGVLLAQEERRDRVSGRGRGTDAHGYGQGRGRGHAHSTSSSTVTASSSHLRRGSSGAPMAGVFPRSDFELGPGYQVQPGYSAQPSHPHYAQALAQLRASQGQHQEATSASHASGFGRSVLQAQPQRITEPQGQTRAGIPAAARAPTARTSTKRTRAPKRPRPDTSAGVGTGPSRGNVLESDDESDDDEIVEWVPGSDDGGGPSGNYNMGFGRSTGTGEPGGIGRGTAQAAPGLPGARKCVSLLFFWSFLLPAVAYDVMLTGSFFFPSFPFAFFSQIFHAIFDHLRPQRTTTHRYARVVIFR